jgi:hypothetical protein
MAISVKNNLSGKSLFRKCNEIDLPDRVVSEAWLPVFAEEISFPYSGLEKKRCQSSNFQR